MADHGEPHPAEPSDSGTRRALVRAQVRGATVRLGASLTLWLFALGVFLLGIIRAEHIVGVSAAVAFLLLMSPPSLWILKRLRRSGPLNAFSVAIQGLEILGYTAVIHALGGVEAAYLSPLYGVLLAAVGPVAIRYLPYLLAALSSAAFALMVLLEHAGVLATHPVVAGHVRPWANQLAIVLVVTGLLFVTAFVAHSNASLLRRSRSALRRRNGELVQARAAAEASSRAKSEFVARMSHDIRTTLIGVLGMTDLLLHSGLSPRQRRLAETASGSGRTLLGIVNDVLDFSKIEAGKLELTEAPFDLREVLEEVVAPLRELAHVKGLELSSELHQEVPVRLRGDALRIQQALINLVANAVKFTEQGQVMLRVVPEEVTDDDALLRFEVEDTGRGIAPEDQQAIFAAFSQGNTTSGRHPTGTGLGLTISRQLAELLGGKIGVRSQLEKGSSFWFTARLRRSLTRMQETFPAPGTDDTTAVCAEPFRAHVLLAEDNAVNQEVTAEMLEVLGCRVDAVGNGREAVEAWSRTVYDLVFMDCEMPVMDGRQATRLIRERERLAAAASEAPLRPPALIIALTAHAFEEARQECLDAGMDDHLPKPFSMDQLGRLLRTWLPGQARRTTSVA